MTDQTSMFGYDSFTGSPSRIAAQFFGQYEYPFDIASKDETEIFTTFIRWFMKTYGVRETTMEWCFASRIKRSLQEARDTFIQAA